MRLAVLQPAGSRVARDHYWATVETPVALATSTPHLRDDDATVLAREHPGGFAAMWGATPGVRDGNVSRWERMAAGDFVFFAAEGRLFSGGVVTHTFRNAALAERLWGRDDDRDQTWELMFTLDELRPLNITYAELNGVVGYAANNIVQGFTVLDEARSAATFDVFGLDSDRHPAVPAITDVQARLDALDGQTERDVDATRRLEQGLLRASLLPGPSADCAICGAAYPAEFLVAAHIKRRSACSTSERLDIPHVAMLACKFGCDALFEAGYVSVDEDGTILVSSALAGYPSIRERILPRAGLPCGAYQEKRVGYFRWHRESRYLG